VAESIMLMKKDLNKTLNGWCSHDGAALALSFDATQITNELKKRLEKRLLKKGLELRWDGSETNSDIAIRIVGVDQGNQLLRWLLPFASPASLEVEGHIALEGPAQQFHYVQRAYFGLFGGSAHGMLSVNAQRVAAKIADDVLRNVKNQSSAASDASQ
jgi:hypothetical protein